MMTHNVTSFGRLAVEDYITKWLSKKMIRRDACRLAGELGHLISSADYGYGDTAEERAMFRETGTRIAEYIIGTLYDDPEDVKCFMDGIFRFVRNDIMLEKGEIIMFEKDSKKHKNKFKKMLAFE